MRDEVSKNWAVSIYLQHFTDHCQCRLSWTQHIYKKKNKMKWTKHNITKQLVANITTFSVVLSYQMVRIWWNKEVWYIENCIKRQNWEDEKMKKKMEWKCSQVDVEFIYIWKFSRQWVVIAMYAIIWANLRRQMCCHLFSCFDFLRIIP